MLNEHDITKKMLNLIREATMPSFNQDMNQEVEGDNQEPLENDNDSNSEKINSIGNVTMEIIMDNITYTLIYKEKDIQISTDGSVQIDIENNEDINKLRQYKNTIWKNTWAKRKNDTFNNLENNVGIIVNDDKMNKDYEEYYNEDINNLQQINSDITIKDYRFTIQ